MRNPSGGSPKTSLLEQAALGHGTRVLGLDLVCKYLTGVVASHNLHLDLFPFLRKWSHTKLNLGCFMFYLLASEVYMKMNL